MHFWFEIKQLLPLQNCFKVDIQILKTRFNNFILCKIELNLIIVND
jgi:hypothetical protein